MTAGASQDELNEAAEKIQATWKGRKLRQELESQGVKVVPIGQAFSSPIINHSNLFSTLSDST